MNGDRHLQEPQLPSRSSMKDYGHFGGQIKNGSSRESYGGGSNFSNGPQQHKSGTSTGYSQTGPVKKSRPPSENALKFHDLLQLAAKKQHDPIVVQKPQTKSVKDADVQGRLMTSEEKRRFVEEQVRKQGRSLDNVELPPRRQKRRKFREDEMDARDGSVVASVLPTKNVQNSPQSRELNERVRNGAAPTATEGMKNKMLPKIPKLGASIPDKPSKHLSDYPSSVKRLKTSTSSSQNVRTVSQTEQKRPQSIHSQREGHVKMKSSLNGPRVSSATVKSKPSSDISRENYPRPDRVDINGNHKMMLAKAKHIQPTKNGLASSRSVTEPPQRSHLPKDVNSRSPSSRPVQASRPSQNPPPPRKEVQRPVDMSSKCQNPPLKQRPQYDNVQRNMQSSSHLAPKKVASQDLVAKQKSLPDLNRKDLGVKQKALAPDISAKQRALQDFGDRHRQSQNLSERKQSLQDQSIRQKPLQNPIERRREQIDLSVTQKAVVANVGAARQMSSVVNQMPKQFPPPDMMPRQFPPPDMMPRQFPPKDVRRPPIRELTIITKVQEEIYFRTHIRFNEFVAQDP